MNLIDKIRSEKATVLSRLYLGKARWDDLLERAERLGPNLSDHNNDEQVWTFLLACVYAFVDNGPSLLASRLTNVHVESSCIWFEVLPKPPRQREGETNLDLALGDIRIRPEKKSGIELARKGISAVFCEFKWYSDISYCVRYDRHRNQLARVIENALCFQSPDREFPTDLHVCLITPACFRDRTTASRLYRYKWAEYTSNRAHILEDLNSCSLPPVQSIQLSDRIEKMRLTWTSFEELAFQAPDSDLKLGFTDYYRAHAGDLLATWPAG